MFTFTCVCNIYISVISDTWKLLLKYSEPKLPLLLVSTSLPRSSRFWVSTGRRHAHNGRSWRKNAGSCPPLPLFCRKIEAIVTSFMCLGQFPFKCLKESSSKLSKLIRMCIFLSFFWLKSVATHSRFRRHQGKKINLFFFKKKKRFLEEILQELCGCNMRFVSAEPDGRFGKGWEII